MEMDGKHKVLLRETGLDNEELLVSMVTQPHRMEAYVCRKPRSIKKEHGRQENEIWKSAKLW